MAIFGWIVILACTVFVSWIALAVLLWPAHRAEKLFMSVICAVLWWATIAGAPFSMVAA